MKDIISQLKENKKQTVILLGIVALLVVFLYLNFVLMPHMSCVARAASKSSKARLDLKATELEVSGLDDHKKELDSNKGKIDDYERTLPEEEQVSTLLEALSETAKLSNVKILSITPIVAKDEAAAKGAMYRELPIFISGRSGYHDLGAFLSRLENADRFMKVVNIRIKSDKLTPKKHDVELTVITYTLEKLKP